MKFWLRTLIAFLTICVIGFTLWAFVFREKDEEATYNKVSQYVDYKYSLQLDKKLKNLNELTYISNDRKFYISNEYNSGKEILNIRKECFSYNDIEIEVESNENNNKKLKYKYNSLEKIKSLTDNLIFEYMPYLYNNKANKSVTKKLNMYIKDSFNNLKNFDKSINDVISTQNNIKNTEVDYQLLLVQYRGFKANYRKVLQSSAGIVLSIQDFINDSICDGSIKFDTRMAFENVFARQLFVTAGVHDMEEIDFMTSLQKVYSLLDEIYRGNNIYGSIINEYKFLLSYNDLNNKYSKNLDYVIGSSTATKNEMANGNSLSNILIEVQPSIINLLKILKFGGTV